MITFVLGPFQFIPYLRHKHPHFHKLLGKCYLVCILISAPTGFIVSFNTHLLLARIGTCLQSIAWLILAIVGFCAIIRKQVALHKRMMARTYALVLAAPFIRIAVYFIENIFGIDFNKNFDILYPILVWCSWLPLISLECFLLFQSKSNGRKLSLKQQYLP